jgi:hypothetical protein
MNLGARRAPLVTSSILPTSRTVPGSQPIPSIPSRKMQYRKLGNTGLDVSLISFGSWVSFDYQLGVTQAKEIMQACYESGVNFVSIIRFF